MKQHITVDQLKKLSNTDYNKLNKYRKEHLLVHHGEYVEDALARYLTIGKMIEIITENNCNEYPHFLTDERGFIAISPSNNILATSQYEEELCDALWETVKKVL